MTPTSDPTIPVRAVLFDFGGVFINSPFAAVEVAAERLGASVEELGTLVFGRYDADTDHPWHRLERGEITFAESQEAIRALADESGLGHIDPFAVLAELAGALEVRDFMIDAVTRYRAAGRLTGIVTNNIAEFGSAWRGLLPVDELFDDVVDSSAVGLRKPDVRIFHLACERLGVQPSEAAFVDDHEGNVAGARAAGLAAVCCGYTVETTRVALVELDRLAGC